MLNNGIYNYSKFFTLLAHTPKLSSATMSPLTLMLSLASYLLTRSKVQVELFTPDEQVDDMRCGIPGPWFWLQATWRNFPTVIKKSWKHTRKKKQNTKILEVEKIITLTWWNYWFKGKCRRKERVISWFLTRSHAWSSCTVKALISGFKASIC